MHKKAIQMRQKKGRIARCDGRPPRVRPARHHHLKAVGTGDPGSSLMFSANKEIRVAVGASSVDRGRPGRAPFSFAAAARAIADVRRHAPRRLGVVCSSRVCPFHRRARVCRRQHPQRTIAACNQAGLRVPGSGRDIQGGARAAPSASASAAARCCCCCFCGCQTALGRHHAGEDAPVGAKPTRTHPSCSATGTTRFPTFLAVARAQACRYSSPWTTPTTQADS